MQLLFSRFSSSFFFFNLFEVIYFSLVYILSTACRKKSRKCCLVVPFFSLFPHPRLSCSFFFFRCACYPFSSCPSTCFIALLVKINRLVVSLCITTECIKENECSPKPWATKLVNKEGSCNIFSFFSHFCMETWVHFKSLYSLWSCRRCNLSALPMESSNFSWHLFFFSIPNSFSKSLIIQLFLVFHLSG